MTHAYLGPGFSSDEVAQLLEATTARALDFRGRTEELLESVVDRLADGKVVGWFQGRMEFGPRALGSRSILADPRRDDMRDRINDLVKKREAFRPFAPAVLADRAHEHFELDHPSPFMLETCQVRSSLGLPAITHVNGSARVQTVDRDASPRFAALLEAFDRRTGCPILLNTSFNMRGEPIVCTPADALACFVRSRMDAVVLEDFVLDREGIPAFWPVVVDQSRPAAPPAVSHQVYTLL
jgi:carbamoyltransferase